MENLKIILGPEDFSDPDFIKIFDILIEDQCSRSCPITFYRLEKESEEVKESYIKALNTCKIYKILNKKANLEPVFKYDDKSGFYFYMCPIKVAIREGTLSIEPESIQNNSSVTNYSI